MPVVVILVFLIIIVLIIIVHPDLHSLVFGFDHHHRKSFSDDSASSYHSGDAFNLSIYRCYSLQRITGDKVICDDDDDGGDDGGDDDDDDDDDGCGDGDDDDDRIIRLVLLPIYGISPQRNHRWSKYLFFSKTLLLLQLLLRRLNINFLREASILLLAISSRQLSVRFLKQFLTRFKTKREEKLRALYHHPK